MPVGLGKAAGVEGALEARGRLTALRSLAKARSPLLVGACWLMVSIATLPAARASDEASRRALDLETAITLALDGNLRFALSALGTQQSRLNVAGAKNRYSLNLRPEIVSEAVRVESGGAQTSTDRQTLLGLTASKSTQFGTDFSLDVQHALDSGTGNGLRWTVQVSQPLLRRFGRLVNAEPLVAAHSALMAAERILIQQEADLVVEVVSSYQDVLRLGQQVEADRASQARIELLARVTGAKERLGRASRVDTLRVDLELGEVRSRLENTVEALALAQTDLAVLIGAPLDARFALAAAPALELELPSIAQAVQVALANRLDYAQSLQDLLDAKRNQAIARRGRLPDVAAFARYESAGLSAALQNQSGATDRSVMVGLTSGRDVFARDVRVDMARAALEATASARRVEILQQVVARSVQQAWLAYRRAGSQILLLERNLDHARSRRDLATRLFGIGRGDNFSVVDAEDAFARAERDLFSGRVDVTVEAHRLLRSLGTLVEAPERLRPKEERDDGV